MLKLLESLSTIADTPCTETTTPSEVPQPTEGPDADRPGKRSRPVASAVVSREQLIRRVPGLDHAYRCAGIIV